MVDLDPQALQAKGLSPRDVNDAINVQNLVLPSGRACASRMCMDYRVNLNNSPTVVDRLNDIPIKTVNGIPVYVRDVAFVHDGNATQTNIVRTNGVRGTLLTILRNGNASTLDIVNGVKKLMPSIQASAPPGMKINLLFDQSTFVTHAIESVLHEGMIAGCLTGAMILLFLGSWRSTLIVLVSIPLSILASVTVLSALGYSINVMTLGGLALAIGILVDDATVEIENIHRNIAMGKPLQQAILDGAQQIATPAFVATLSICIVFIPVVLLEGPAKFLFVPFALAVVFAVFTSYILSRTIVPVLVKYLLRGRVACAGERRRRPAFSAVSIRLQRRLRESPQLVCEHPRLGARPSPRHPGRLWHPARQRVHRPALDRAGFLPHGRCRPDSSARRRRQRHTTGGDGKDLLGGRSRDPENHPRPGRGDDHR